LNPFFHNEESVFEAIKSNDDLFLIRDEIKLIYFYGAGCSSEKLNAIIERGLNRVFVNAEIHVDHDLNACAYATYEGEPSISCILGTGSNSCYYDGKNVIEVVPALGYILGDEGSGTYFGKQLLSNYLYKRLPENIYKSFKEETGLTKDDIVSNVYMKPNANVYLASFMKFITKHADDEYIKEMFYEGFKRFNDIHVCCYSNYKDCKVHYIGSIAFLFADELKRACDFYDIQLGNIIRKPIDGLIRYHEALLNSKI
jgi:glucosamine kinase